MVRKQIRIIREDVERRFLPFVRRPGRYVGGEINHIQKDLSVCDVTVALCFPDIYEIGMSHTGMAIIYHVLNSLEGVAAERVFAPWTDAEKVLRKKNISLFTLESMAAAGDFDVIGFSMTNELCYTNMLNMLDLAGVPIRSKDRGEGDPFVIVGGQASNCAEPIADFVDLFILGEGEEAVVKLAELLKEYKKRGDGRADFLLEAANRFDFVYVPSLYSFEYDGDRIKSFRPSIPELPVRFANAVVEDFDNAPVPDKPIVPFVKAVHERVSVEIMRGCPGRCRFCQASFCRRPIRFRSVDKIVETAKANYHATGFNTISLLSLSSADYPDLEELVIKLQDYFDQRHVGISLPSLKVKDQLKLLPKLVSSVRKSGLTIAVEAAGEKLRRIINKPISDEDLLAGIEAAYMAGFQKVKLYFMVGLPQETEEDIKAIVDLSYKIAKLRKKIDSKTANVNITISWFVPKAHTPFGWLSQKDRDYFEKVKRLILDQKRNLRARFLQFKFHEIETSLLESAMSRGDRRLGDVIETAWQSGAKFDLWNECFDFEIWQKAFEKHGMNLDTAAQREFKPEEILPWQHLGGPDRDYLLKHLNEAMDTAQSS